MLPESSAVPAMKRLAESLSQSASEIPLDRINLSDADRAAAKVALRHGEAIANVIYRVMEWFDRTAHRAHQRELESFLAQSTDHADLERRMREITYGASRLKGG
jgi:hypothetical protein